LGWGDVAFPEHLEDGQECLRAALKIQNRVLLGLGYRHGNFGRIGIKRLNELLEPLGVCGAEAERTLGYDVSDNHAIWVPGQLPEPSPSGAGAGWAIGVALP